MCSAALSMGSYQHICYCASLKSSRACVHGVCTAKLLRGEQGLRCCTFTAAVEVRWWCTALQYFGCCQLVAPAKQRLFFLHECWEWSSGLIHLRCTT